jgi:hypothetical protein
MHESAGLKYRPAGQIHTCHLVRTAARREGWWFSPRPSEAAGGGEEPYSCTATNPDCGIAKGSAKNTALLNGRRGADSAPATLTRAGAPRRLRARRSTKLRSACCRKPASDCTTRPNPRLRPRRPPRSAARCAGRTCTRRGQSSAPGNRHFYRFVARSIDCPFGLSLHMTTPPAADVPSLSVSGRPSGAPSKPCLGVRPGSCLVRAIE